MKILRMVPYGSFFTLVLLMAIFADGAYGQESQAQNSTTLPLGGTSQSQPNLKAEQEARDCASLGNYCSIEKCRNNQLLKGSCNAFGSRDDTKADGTNKPTDGSTSAGGGTSVDLFAAPPGSGSPGAGSGLPPLPTQKPPTAPKPDPVDTADAGSGNNAGSDDKGTADKDPSDLGNDNQNADSGGGGGTSQQSRAQCQAAAQRAASACGSQGGGGFGSYSGGINTYGTALGDASGGASSANLQAAIQCTSQWRNCSYQCAQTDPYLAGQCEAYANQVSQMGRQAQQAYQAQQGAYNSGAQSAASSLPFQQTKLIENCDFNPNSAECQALAASKRREQGQSGFEQTEVSDPNFNVGGGDGPQTQYNAAFTYDPAEIQPGPKNKTVPNNSGGQIPGAGGDQNQAQLAARGRGSPGAPGYSTDVMQGFRNGGVGSAASVGGTNVNPANGFKSYGNARAPGSNSGEGFDLKRYLPGGSAQNGRNLGGFIPYSIEINGPSVNIWTRISDRFMEKCRLGELLDCR